jgi:hypothetical protein
VTARTEELPKRIAKKPAATCEDDSLAIHGRWNNADEPWRLCICGSVL